MYCKPKGFILKCFHSIIFFLLQMFSSLHKTYKESKTVFEIALLSIEKSRQTKIHNHELSDLLKGDTYMFNRPGVAGAVL